MSPSHTQWGPLRSLFVLVPILAGSFYSAYDFHSRLPEPITELTNPSTSLPQLSEKHILGYAQYLSEDIGFRTVGTKEHALADAWMVEKAHDVRRECESIVAQSARSLQCEVWRQEGSGSHRFDMMNKRLYKTYVNLTNIVVRISDGTPQGKENAVLINSHLDSTLPSPGAADDALAVGIMLECIRVLINTPDWTPKHAIIFLFNNAEESLQDGSHLYSTQHLTAPTMGKPSAHYTSSVRAVINLEAAGSTGRELLFQATSEQMIEAYSHVPRPFGTIFANDIFSSGVILSDTDFRQFEEYLNVTGLDMAVVGNSYIYHMRKDLVQYIQPGVAQHMAENTFALLHYMSSSKSPLPSLTEGYTKPTTVYFSLFGKFFVYSFATAKVLYGVLFFSSLVFVNLTFPSTHLGEKRIWGEQLKGVAAVVASLVGTVVVPNLVALLMRNVLGKGMSWFSHEYYPLILYGPPAFFGSFLSQLMFGKVKEQTLLTSILLLQTGAALFVQVLGVGSAAIFYVSGLTLLISLAVNMLVAENGQVSLFTYALGAWVPMSSGTLFMTQVLEVFVPLTGRIGGEAPADHIIATIVSLLGAISLPLTLPFAQRFGRRALVRATMIAAVLSVFTISIFYVTAPFDPLHQKRLFVLHLENVTTNEHHMHIAAADGASGFESLAQEIAHKFGPSEGPGLVPVVMDHSNNDWDTLYPFSQFLAPYQIKLSVSEGYVSPWANEERFGIKAVYDVVDETARTRSLKIEVTHPGLIWTVISFDAHVLMWNLDGNPPDENTRHIIKEASFYGTEKWSLDLVVKLPLARDEGIRINYVGVIEAGMWPGKKAEKEKGGLAMVLFEELDEWLIDRTGGTVDATLLGCVGGVITI